MDKKDEYKFLKDALKEGKLIQARFRDSDYWSTLDIATIEWTLPVSSYRVKPDK